ncbi:hypothetical protein [Rhodoglobus aureus]|uniref:Uncharacterized protein n=1 Tax=Rhodoglobus aureus TaxID=191497 RepID=A0ABP4GL96_9MICO
MFNRVPDRRKIERHILPTPGAVPIRRLKVTHIDHAQQLATFLRAAGLDHGSRFHHTLREGDERE